MGQDKLMITYPLYKNFPFVKFVLEKEHTDLYDYLVKKYKPYIDDPKSKLRLHLVDEFTYDYTKRSSEEIIKYTFVKVDSIHDLNMINTYKKAAENPNHGCFLIANNGFIFLGSHVFYDGICSYWLANKCMDTEFTPKIPYYRYIPFYNEFLMLFSMNKLFQLLFFKKNLSISYNWQNSDHFYSIKQKFSLALIKKLKVEFNKRSSLPISFASLFSAIQLFNIFKSIDKDVLTVGLVVGFSNKTRFNNFAAIPMKVKRIDNFGKFVSYFNNLVNENKNLVPVIFSTTNIYNVNIPVNSYIDVLISGMPLTGNDILYVDNIKLDYVEGYLQYFSMPIYILYLSDSEFVHTNIHLRTEDVNRSKLKSLTNNTNSWLEEYNSKLS